MRRSTVLRAFANGAMRVAEWVVPRDRSSWAQAMRSELEQIDHDLEALTWALGCCVSSLRLFVRESMMKRESTVSFALSFLFGAAIWALSPRVTGRTEPWDANSAFYVAALLGTGLIVGALCPRKIWPIWLGLAIGQFTYMLLFLLKGPLIAVGFVTLFIYGVVAVAGAFVSSRLRRVLTRADDANRPGL